MGISFSCIAAVRNCAIRSSVPFQISASGCVSVATIGRGSPVATPSCAGISKSAGSSSSNFSSTPRAAARSVESTTTSNPNRGFQSIGNGSAVGATSSSPRVLAENGIPAASNSSSNAACTAGSSPAHSGHARNRKLSLLLPWLLCIFLALRLWASASPAKFIPAAHLPQFPAQFLAPGLRRMDTRKPLLRLHHLPRARQYYFRARHLLKIPSMSGRYQSKFRGSLLCPGPLLFLASRLALHHLAVKPCLVAFPSAVFLGFCWPARGLTRVQPPGIRIVSSVVSGNSLRAARQDKHS